MGFKRINCPVCEQKVSHFWYYSTIIDLVHTCSNCNTKIKLHSINRLFSVICGGIMFGLFFLIKDYFEQPIIAVIIAGVIGLIIYMLLPKKVKIISRGREEMKD